MTLIVSCDQNEVISFDAENGQTLAYFKDDEVKIPIEMDGSGTITFNIGVTTKSSNDRTVTLAVVDEDTTADSNMYSFISTSATIPANEYNTSFTMNADWDDVLSTEEKLVYLKLDTVDGGITSTSYLKVRIYEGCNPNNLLTLTINFDGYSEEESWELRDVNNALVMSNAYGAGISSTSEEVCIEDGTYTFTIFDSYGDGLYDGVTTGNYELSKGDIIYASGSGNYGSSESTTFTK